VTRPGRFHRDRVTWLAYGALCLFAYFEVSPGPVMPYLREELGLDYTTAGLYLVAFPAGALLTGLLAGRVERRLGRRRMLWTGLLGAAAGAVALTLGRQVAATLAATAVMGLFAGLVLVAVQAVLADHHGERRAVAFGESNTLASLVYTLTPLSIAGAVAAGLGWRAALAAAALATVALWLARRHVPIPESQAASAASPADPAASPADLVASPADLVAGRADPAAGRADPVAGPAPGRLPVGFWLVCAVLACGVAAEWCIGFWGAPFLHDVIGLPTGTAVAVMSVYYVAMTAGRAAGSVVARRQPARRLLWVALGTTAAGVAVFWTAGGPVLAVAGLLVAGLGVANLYPLSLAVGMEAAPGRSGLASARFTVAGAVAALVGPLGIGRLADAGGIRAALTVVPALILVAAAALAAVALERRRPRAGVG
jgi:predicted MFS family arabinose efflux permease